jgi:hypothetical protein
VNGPTFHVRDHVLAEQARLGFEWDLSYIRPALAAARRHARSLRPERYPFTPVERHAHLHGISTVSDLAIWLGCSRQQIYRLRNGMSWMVADRLATYLNMHPTALWPDWGLDLEVAS